MSSKNRNRRQEDQMEANEATLTTRIKDEGFWREMWRQARLVWHLLRSPDVPLYLKLLPALAVVYILIPTDFIPDVFPVIGQLDDLTALLVGAKVFIELAPQEVVARHIQAMRQQSAPAGNVDKAAEKPETDPEDSIIIEGNYQVVEEQNKDRTG
ncbi:MAG TPA: hypothetical protein DEP47_03580 [Chloroflexi bacterium]|jgi:uncharacterized membrane protein YkvA (DUF1232 family)|nr:hypothetical protein [Chloroflexota bacterium]